MSQAESKSATLIEALRKSFATASRSAPGEVPPVAILWPDADGQWQGLIAQLRNLMPELLTLGTFSPEQRQGPAIWLRCMIERMLPQPVLPEQTIPVLYLPKVSRQTLRAVDGCPDYLEPLVELQYRGAIWCQRNGKDWTVEAFLVAQEDGLGLDVARDNSTRLAFAGALPQLAITPLIRLRGKRLEAEDFDKLMVEDTTRNLLEWLSEPAGTRKRWDMARWIAFCSRCKAEYGFDPERDGELVAGERLGMSEGLWAGIWERFAEAPSLYPGISVLLRRAKPNTLHFRKETWPDENETAEKSLRSALLELANLPAGEARNRITQLETEHGFRRQWVWVVLGMSPLAKALEYLAALAKHTAVSLGGDSPDQMGNLYSQGAYLADDALLRALAEVRSAEDWKAVSAAIQAVYLPWLEDAAEHFQKLVAANSLPAYDPKFAETDVGPGTCVMFVDGLRFDLGMRLSILAQSRNMRVTHGRRWAALPTVTATAKPATLPLGQSIVGHHLGADFCPEVRESGQPYTSARFKDIVVDTGYQWLSDSESGRPFETDARAWTEYGEFDKLGHNLQAKLAAQVDSQLELIGERISALLASGWKQVRVITDHGWLLVPGGLPSMSLPKYLTESRWARCAAVKPGAQVQAPLANWHWNPSEAFAYASGARCFGRGMQYAHGGISLQECLIPDLVFQASAASVEVASKIVNVQWFGLRCRVLVGPAAQGLAVDLRTRVSDATSSITKPKAIDSEGQAGLLVEDDSLEGSAAIVVLMDVSGRVLSRQATSVGGEN
ncbi:BREX-1 system phosphatase PglZ type B [Elusimicrobiota bacterium]